MAVRPPTTKDLRTKELLEAAAARLRADGEPEMAGAVDEVLAPGGWSLLARLRAADGPSAPAPNLSIPILEDVKTALLAAAEGANLTADVNEGLQAFVDGTFSPKPPKRAAYGSKGVKVSLNVRPNAELRAQAEQVAADREEELGFKPTVRQIALDYLLRKYPVTEDTTAG